MGGPILGLYTEHLSVVLRGIGFTRPQTRRNSTTSMIAKANIDITRSIFVRSRQPSTTYRLKRLATLLSFHVESTVRDCRKEDLFTMFSYFAPVTSHSVQTMRTMFCRKDFFRLFDGLHRISTRKTNAEPTFLISLGGHDGGFAQRNITNWSTHIIWLTLIRI